MLDYTAIEQRVRLRHNRRYRFILHTLVTLVGFVAFGGRMEQNFALVWGGLWALHLIWVRYRSSLERAIEAEIAKEMRRLDSEKPKRNLQDTYADEPDWDEEALAQSNGRLGR